jgi:hypothetical protein
MVNSSRSLLSDASLVRLHGRIAAIIQGASPLREIGQVVEEADDRILDTFRICTAFENLFKAELLRDGVLVHCIDPSEDPSSFGALCRRQGREPVYTSELPRGSLDSETLPFLRSVTLGLGLLSQKCGYANKLGITGNLLEALDQFRRKRNTLHFLAPAMAEYSQQVLAGIAVLVRDFNARALPLYQSTVAHGRTAMPPHFRPIEL